MYVDPIDPLFLEAPTKRDFDRRRCYFYVPELHFAHLGVRHLPCPNCGEVWGEVTCKGWNPKVRKKEFGVCARLEGPNTWTLTEREALIVCVSVCLCLRLCSMCPSCISHPWVCATSPAPTAGRCGGR